MTAHGGTIVINGNRYLVARDPQTKRRLVDITLAPSAEGDLVEQELVASFGSGGMGSSLPAVRDQHELSIDLDTWSVWDQVAAGDEVRRVGLTLGSAVTKITAAFGRSTTSGPRLPVSAADVTGFGTVAWTNVGNITAEDGVVATVALNPGEISHSARATNLSLAITGGTTVAGISVEVKLSAPIATNVNIWASVVLSGTVRATKVITTVLTTSLAWFSFGGLADTWGLGLTAANIADATFGVDVTIQSTNGVGSPAATHNLDAVRVTVQQRGSTKVIYAAGGNVSSKLTVSSGSGTPVFTLVETKAFTHGDFTAAPQISDVRVNKDGTASGNCFVVFAFGSDAQIQQVDAISSVGADTYGALAGSKAYAGKFLATMSPTVGLSYLYKTGGTNQSGGAFNYLQYLSIGSGTVDATAPGTWSPGGDGMQIGDPSTAINALTEFERGPVAHKPEGSYTFDTKQAPFAIVKWSSRVESNGLNARSWQEFMLVPAEGDLAAIPPITRDGFVGLSTLQANLSPIVGTVEDMVGFRHAMYLLVWTGTDTYLVRVRRTDSGDRAPHPLLWWGVTKIAGYHAQALGVVADAQGTVYLLFSYPSATPGAHDVAYMVLAPESMRRTQTGGFLQTTRLGTAGRKMVLRSWPQFGVGLNSTNYFDADVQWDESGTWANVGRFNQNGPQTLTWTPGTNDSGSQAQFRLRCTRSVDTNRPTLRGASSHQEGPGGIVVRAFVQPDTVTRITATLELGAYEAGQGGTIRETALEQKTTLEPLCGPTNAAVPIISRPDFGDENPRWVRWQRMSEQPQPDTQPDKKPSWQVKLEGILL